MAAYVFCLTNMYMRSLEDNQNITNSVRTEFDALLNSKDTIIQNLQSELITTKQLKMLFFDFLDLFLISTFSFKDCLFNSKL